MKGEVAAITMVFNEPVFLPIWLNYYGAELGYENLFIIDDGSNDTSLHDKRIVNLISRKRGVLDEELRAETISYFHEELLGHYNQVLYTDVDEFIVAEPNLKKSLEEYLISRHESWINPVGLNVLHRRSEEGPLDLTKPLFSQRSYVQFTEWYCKPVISRVPMRWKPGFHFADRPPCCVTDLFLFHLRAMDYDIARERIKKFESVSFSEESLRQGFGLHFRMEEQSYLDLYFSRPEADFDAARPEIDFADQLSKIGKPRTGAQPLARVGARFRDAIILAGAGMATSASQRVGGAVGAEPGKLYSAAISRMAAGGAARRRNAPCPCGSGKRFKHCHGLAQAGGASPQASADVAG